VKTVKSIKSQIKEELEDKVSRKKSEVKSKISSLKGKEQKELVPSFFFHRFEMTIARERASKSINKQRTRKGKGSCFELGYS